MKLTEEQKGALKALKNSYGWEVLKMVEEEAMVKLAKQLYESDLDNDKHVETIKKNQIYMKARRDFMANVESHTREIYTPEA